MPARYRIELTRHAWHNLREIERTIAADSPARAKQFLQQLQRQIRQLDRFPLRCRPAPEGMVEGVPIRQKHFKAYRILFAVQDRTVFVVGIRHASRLPLSTLPR